MKIANIAVIVLTVLLSGAVVAQEKELDLTEDQQASVVDQVIESCEAQYSIETYTDENERNNLIDQCVDDALKANRTQPEQG